jgi:hypothetical protein
MFDNSPLHSVAHCDVLAPLAGSLMLVLQIYDKYRYINRIGVGTAPCFTSIVHIRAVFSFE